GRRRSGRGGRRRGRGRRHAHPWFPVLTRTDQCSATPVEALARHALRCDVGGALFEAHRSLEVLLAWLVLRDRGPTQDEHRENPKARSCVLFHRSSLLPASTLPRASQVTACAAKARPSVAQRTGPRSRSPRATD